jgi:hypothetical protein
MSEDAKDFVAIVVCIALIICGMIFFLSPSPMQICIKAGYEWRGGDCVMGVQHD